MQHRLSRFLLLAVVLCGASSLFSQIIPPMEMHDPAMRRLQQQHMKDLKEMRAGLKELHFPYDFYFSRKLDIDEPAQQQADQRSIRFEKYNNQTALEITGNYYAAYSDAYLDDDHRLRQTYIDVILPILQIVVPPLQSAREVDAFAVEISHHVCRKVIGVTGEYPENVVVVIPRELAARVVQTKDLIAQQNLMLDAEIYRNGQPTILWLAGERPVIPEDRSADNQEPPPIHSSASPAHRGLLPASLASHANSSATPPPELRGEPLHDASPDALKALEDRFREPIEKLTKEQATTISFVPYAPPSFINFRQGAYLQISMSTKLDIRPTDSQYKLAALAFDREIAHLVRPVLSYFKEASGFDGVDFSTTVKFAEDKDGAHATAVEFVLPLAALNCFQQYDCTGQQLLDAGVVLINGERAGIQLQTAETETK